MSSAFYVDNECLNLKIMYFLALCHVNRDDLDILIEMSDYYGVELRELLDGERKSEKMNKDLEETVLKVADYSNDEKIRLMKKLHFFLG